MRNKAPMPTQAAFPFTRGGQLQMWRVAVFPTVNIQEGNRVRRVGPRDLYDVLRVLDDHGPQCFPKLETIAAEARMSRSLVARTMKALVQIDVLCRDKKPRNSGGFRIEYTINWQAISALCSPPEARSPAGTRTVPRRDSHRPPMGTLIDQEPPNEPPAPYPLQKTIAPQAGGRRGWGAVEDEFRGQVYIASLIAVARERDWTPERLSQELRAALEAARLPENARNLASPEGAAVAFLRSGRWPIDNMLTADEALALRAKESQQTASYQEYLASEAALDRQIALERSERLASNQR